MRVRKCTRVHKIGVWRVFTSSHDTLGYLYTLIMGVISIRPNYSQTNRNVENTHTLTERETHIYLCARRPRTRKRISKTHALSVCAHTSIIDILNFLCFHMYIHWLFCSGFRFVFVWCGSLSFSNPLCKCDVSLFMMRCARPTRCPFRLGHCTNSSEVCCYCYNRPFFSDFILFTRVTHPHFFFLLQLTFILNLTHWINKFQCNFCGTAVDWSWAEQKLYTHSCNAHLMWWNHNVFVCDTVTVVT